MDWDDLYMEAQELFEAGEIDDIANWVEDQVGFLTDFGS